MAWPGIELAENINERIGIRNWGFVNTCTKYV